MRNAEFQDQLVRGLTHKMNNILSLFHGYLGLMIEDKKVDRETLSVLLRIRDSANAASRLMDRTKALATPSASVWRQVPPEDFLRTLMPSLELFEERGVNIQVACDPGLSDLWVDASRLRMAFKEIVKNACEASPANGVVLISAKPYGRAVRARGRRLMAPPISWVALTVTDCGKGIPLELNSKIFQPFFTTKSKGDSMGLGLSVALGLVQQLGGTIRLQSRPGRTSVKVLLPCRAAQ